MTSHWRSAEKIGKFFN